MIQSSVHSGLRGTGLLLHRDGSGPAGVLRHGPVRVQLGSERDLGVRAVGRVLVPDQQVSRSPSDRLLDDPYRGPQGLRLLHRQDTTRVDQVVPLRANWALPYFSCQVAALTGFLSDTGSAAEVCGSSSSPKSYCGPGFDVSAALAPLPGPA